MLYFAMFEPTGDVKMFTRFITLQKAVDSCRKFAAEESIYAKSFAFYKGKTVGCAKRITPVYQIQYRNTQRDAE